MKQTNKTNEYRIVRVLVLVKLQYLSYRISNNTNTHHNEKGKKENNSWCDGVYDVEEIIIREWKNILYVCIIMEDTFLILYYVYSSISFIVPTFWDVGDNTGHNIEQQQ